MPYAQGTLGDKEFHKQRFCSRICAGKNKRLPECQLPSCIQCGSKLKHSAEKYCSYACRDLARWGAAKVVRICETCGSDYFRPPSGGKGNGIRYCSTSCRARAQERRQPFTCRQCGVMEMARPATAEKRVLCSTCSAPTNPIRTLFDGSTHRIGTHPPRRLLSAGYYENACAICREDRYVELAHIIPQADGGSGEPWNILSLCPNHHRYFDKGLLRPDEIDCIREKCLLALERAGLYGLQQDAVRLSKARRSQPLLRVLLGGVA